MWMNSTCDNFFRSIDSIRTRRVTAACRDDYGMKFNVSGSGPTIGISNRSVGVG